MKNRIMYIESKNGSLMGTAKIGLVRFSKTGKSIYYQDQMFQSTNQGFKANFFDAETGAHYWISGCKKDGTDRLYGERLPIVIDDDIREEYWVQIRNLPECKHIKVINPKHQN